MKQTMYKIDNVVSECLVSLLSYFRAIGDTSVKEVVSADIDCYLTYHNKSKALSLELKELFINAGIDPSVLSPVHVVLDPRLDKIFGTFVIPNRVILRKEERTYCTVQVTNDHYLAKSYYLNKLIQETEFSFVGFKIIKDTYYGFNSKNKLKPFTLTMDDSERYMYKYNYTFDGLKKAEYNYYTINTFDRELSTEIRRVYDKESYSMHKSTKNLGFLGACLLAIPKFQFNKFKKMSVPLYF